MGIKGLSKFLGDHAPRAVRQHDIKSFMGRIIAIDASMSLYQFMIAIRDSENFGNLTNEAGEATSHIHGFFSRAVRLLECGIKPVYVFDGKATTLKSGELAKRSERRAKAEVELADAQERGEKDEIKKFMGRTVKITRQHNEDVKELLRLMGVPIIEAPNEAEAQCAKLSSAGLVYATATEDADALTLGTPILIRHLNFSEAKVKAKPLLAFHLDAILEDLNMTMEQFVDFCILCGCDYCDPIRGIGVLTAYKLIKQHKKIESVLENIDSQKYPLPECFPYQEARSFFLNPEVLSEEDTPKLSWKEPDEAGLKAFLVDRHNFNLGRVDNLLGRLAKSKSQSSQTRLEAFFGPVSVKKPLPATSKSKAKAKPKGKSAAASTTTKKRSSAMLSPPTEDVKKDGFKSEQQKAADEDMTRELNGDSAKRLRVEEEVDAKSQLS